jgi:hypothetical protein
VSIDAARHSNSNPAEDTLTTLCRIVLTIVSCTFNPATVPTPEDAVAIFAASAGPYRVLIPDEPQVPGWVYNTPPSWGAQPRA